MTLKKGGITIRLYCNVEYSAESSMTAFGTNSPSTMPQFPVGYAGDSGLYFYKHHHNSLIPTPSLPDVIWGAMDYRVKPGNDEGLLQQWGKLAAALTESLLR